MAVETVPNPTATVPDKAPSVPPVEAQKSLLADAGGDPAKAALLAKELAELSPEGIAKSKADAADAKAKADAAAAAAKPTEAERVVIAEKAKADADAAAAAKALEDAKTPEQKAADVAAKVAADAAAAKAIEDAKTPEQKAADAVIAEKAKVDAAAKAAQEPWKLEAPDWLPKSDVEAYEKWGRDEKLTKEQTQKFLTTAAARQVETYNRLFTVYADQIKADKEFGGDKLPETLANAKRFLLAHASPEERAVIDTAPEGSHPLFIKIMARAGARMREDGFIMGTPGGAPEKNVVQKLYGDDGRGPKTP